MNTSNVVLKAMIKPEWRRISEADDSDFEARPMKLAQHVKELVLTPGKRDGEDVYTGPALTVQLMLYR